MTRRKSTRAYDNAQPELADAFAIKLFQKDVDLVDKINTRTHIRKSTIVRTALSWAFDNGFKL